MNSVSIAMATCNGELYLREQLASLADQSFTPAELIVTDDCSADATLDIVTDFARNAPFPVRTYRNETRLGYRANFMRAASLCSSDLIAFCDQDDVWDRRKIAACEECFKNPDVLLTYHNILAVTSEGRSIDALALGRRAAPQALNPAMSLNPWHFGLGFTQVFRRSLPLLPDLWGTSIDQNVPKEPMAHDQWFFFLASVLGSVVYIAEPLAVYRQHGRNLTGLSRDRGKAGFETRFFSAGGADVSAPYENAARRRADILDLAKGEWNATWQKRASKAVECYRQLERAYASRRVIYTSPNISDRLMAFRDIIFSGGYAQNNPWKFSYKSLIKDACVGVFLGHKLKRTVTAAPLRQRPL